MCRGEAFANGYIAALREKKSDEFRGLFRSVDVWLVDDIQTLASMEHTKEEFFHTFNTLHQTGKQVVLSSDRAPRELRLMDERLRSRFESGLIADVAPPDVEMRIAILQQKAESERPGHSRRRARVHGGTGAKQYPHPGRRADPADGVCVDVRRRR